MNTPLLSIIVPVYKVELWLPACIDSILRQTYQTWELILIDDGSPDRCGAICDTYAAKDKRIKVIHKNNAGVSAARNDGLDLAQGDYITFVDSDDEIGSVDTFEKNIAILQTHPNVDILQYPLGHRSNDETCAHSPCMIHNKAGMLKALTTFSITGYLWGKIFRKILFAQIRLPQDIAFAEDTWCLLDVIPHTRAFIFSNKGNYLYNMRVDSAVHSFDSKKCLDLFLMSFKFLAMLHKYLPPSDPTCDAYFFITYQRLLDARIANNDNVGKEYVLALRKYVPALFVSSSRGRTFKNKIWILLLKCFGISNTSNAYVRFVLWRLTSR